MTLLRVYLPRRQLRRENCDNSKERLLSRHGGWLRSSGFDLDRHIDVAFGPEHATVQQTLSTISDDDPLLQSMVRDVLSGDMEAVGPLADYLQERDDCRGRKLIEIEGVGVDDSQARYDWFDKFRLVMRAAINRSS